MVDVLKHGFVSAVPDGPDANLVRPSNWNAEHVFAGGVNGQALVFDDSQSDNVSWIDVDSPSLIGPVFGAVGDGIADDTGAFQQAADSGNGRILVPPGVYRITSTITVNRAVTFFGVGAVPGSVAIPTVPAIHHEFNGDLFVFDGSLASTRGAGGGLENLCILNRFGSPGSANGNAVVVTGTSTALRGTWLRFRNLNIQEISGFGQWSRGIFLNGQPIGAALDNVRDVWIENSRINVDTGGVSAIGIDQSENIFILNTILNGALGDLVITGDSSSRATQIFVIGGGGNTLNLDWCQGVSAVGCNFATFVDTVNSLDTVISSGKVTNLFSLNGTGYASYFHPGSSKTILSSLQTPLLISRDLGPTTTNQIAFEIGNTNVDQGTGIIRFVNALPANNPKFDIRFFPRNNADSGLAPIIGGLTFEKTVGADTGFAKIESSTGDITIRADGTTVFSHAQYNNGLAVVASGASITLPLTSNFISITGTTSIDTINATGQAGRIVFLTFTAGLNLNNGTGNLILSGTIGITANDCIILGCNGTNWFQLAAYSVNP